MGPLTLFIPGFLDLFRPGGGGGGGGGADSDPEYLSNRNKTYRIYSMSKNLSFYIRH